jgi:hypothetical protein
MVFSPKEGFCGFYDSPKQQELPPLIRSLIGSFITGRHVDAHYPILFARKL